MRRLFSLLLATAVATAIACDGTLLRIPVSDSAQTVVQQGTLLEELVGSMGFGGFLNMDVTSATELQNQGVAPGDISSVELTEFSLSAVDPDGADLSFLESVDLYVDGPDLPEVLVASALDFPEGQATVEFDLEDVDLTDYVVSQSMTLRTDVSGRRPDEDTTVEASFTLSIGVTGQGACNAIGGG